MKKPLIITGVILIVLVFSLFGYYNKFVTANENVDGQWAQVESQYQRGFDLIPNLVNSVKGVMTQEKEVFGMIADARTKYAGAASVNEKAGAATEVESALGRLLVIMENYPQLKSADTTQGLMAELSGTENRISVERKRFNDSVRGYNIMTKRFPGNIMAGMFNFDERNYFEIAQGADVVPEINLTD